MVHASVPVVCPLCLSLRLLVGEKKRRFYRRTRQEWPGAWTTPRACSCTPGPDAIAHTHPAHCFACGPCARAPLSPLFVSMATLSLPPVHGHCAQPAYSQASFVRSRAPWPPPKLCLCARTTAPFPSRLFLAVAAARPRHGHWQKNENIVEPFKKVPLYFDATRDRK